jgi:hypothetical protein
MSTVNNGPQIVKTSLAFVLDPTVSAGYIKTPKQISNCITWFDADDLSTITTETSTRNVRFWADKSASNLVLTGGGLTLANEPLSVLAGMNGRNTMRFDGADYIYGAFTTSYTEFTIFLVLKGDISNNTYQYPFSINNGTNTNNFHFDVNDPDGSSFARTLWVYWNSGGSPYSILPLTSPNTTSDFLQGSPTLLTFSHTNAGSGTNIIYVNGKARSDQVNASTQTITIGGSGFNLYMGARSTGLSGPYYGDICELIIYSRQLSTTERSQVHNYLSNKWRIPFLQTTLTNRDLIFGKLPTCQNNNIPVLDKSYRVNPADATGSPKTSNFYFADSVSWLSSLITTTITMEAWVKPHNFAFAGNNTDLGTIMIANSNFYLSLDGNGKFNAFMYGSAGSTVSHQPSTTSVTRHAWNHVVWTFDGAYIRWYLNGVLDKTSSTTFTIGTINLNQYLGIGAEGLGTYGRMLDGYVAGCKIYGKALSAAEISQNYESSKTEFSNLPNMVSNNVRCYYDADIYSSYIGSGTSLVDLSGGGYTATINNAPTFASTEPKTFILNGTTQDITLPSNFNNALTSGTWEFWVNCASLPATSAIQQLYIQEACVWLAMYNVGGGAFFGCDLNNGSGWFDGNGGSTTGAKTTSTLSANTWYHITYSWNGSNVRVYLNGNLESTTSTLQAINGRQDVTQLGAGTTPRSIGSRSGSYFNGKISMFRNYNISLSTAEVLQNYNAQKFRFGK